MQLLPFDAHNHVQLGPTPIIFDDVPSSVNSRTATVVGGGGANEADDGNRKQQLLDGVGTAKSPPISLSRCLSGMAVMGTHPNDFPHILQMKHDCGIHQREQQQQDLSNFHVVACLGVHPWFLHELHGYDWDLVEPQNPSVFIPSLTGTSTTPDEHREENGRVPRWVSELEQQLIVHADCPVGEIGIDGFHFDPTTKELSTPLEKQADAFMYQLQLATVYERPVSVHCVRATGKIMDVLNHVYGHNKKKATNNKKKSDGNGVRSDDNDINKKKDQNTDPGRLLPPRIYFHAFGGKAATVTQLIQTLERKGSKGNQTPKSSTTTKTTKCYFGFAPIINFESHKTMDVVKTVGLDRLVLETDHEDAACVESSMKLGIKIIADALSISEEELIRVTNANAKDLYQL